MTEKVLNAVQYIELGLRLAQFLNTGKQPNKYSDRMWEIAIKLLDTPTELELIDHTKGSVL